MNTLRIHTIQDLVTFFEKYRVPMLKKQLRHTPIDSIDIQTEWNDFIMCCGEDRTISSELENVAIHFDIIGAIMKGS
jgi:hypothetical protein